MPPLSAVNKDTGYSIGLIQVPVKWHGQHFSSGRDCTCGAFLLLHSFSEHEGKTGCDGMEGRKEPSISSINVQSMGGREWLHYLTC